MRAGFNWEMGPFQLWDAAGVRATVQDRNETIGYKIRAGTMDKIPYLLVIGDRVVPSGTGRRFLHTTGRVRYCSI